MVMQKWFQLAKEDREENLRKMQRTMTRLAEMDEEEEPAANDRLLAETVKAQLHLGVAPMEEQEWAAGISVFAPVSVLQLLMTH